MYFLTNLMTKYVSAILYKEVVPNPRRYTSNFSLINCFAFLLRSVQAVSVLMSLLSELGATEQRIRYRTSDKLERQVFYMESFTDNMPVWLVTLTSAPPSTKNDKLNILLISPTGSVETKFRFKILNFFTYLSQNEMRFWKAFAVIIWLWQCVCATTSISDFNLKSLSLTCIKYFTYLYAYSCPIK